MAGEVGITIGEEDYVGANRVWFLHYLRRRKVLVRYALLLASLAAALAMLEWSGGGGAAGILRVVAFAIVGGGAGLLLCNGIGYVLLPRRARRLFRQNPSFYKSYHYHWSDDGLAYRSERESGMRPWKDFYRWSDGSEALLLMLNEQLFYIIPRRALTDAQAEDLRATLGAHGPPRF